MLDYLPKVQPTQTGSEPKLMHSAIAHLPRFPDIATYPNLHLQHILDSEIQAYLSNIQLLLIFPQISNTLKFNRLRLNTVLNEFLILSLKTTLATVFPIISLCRLYLSRNYQSLTLPLLLSNYTSTPLESNHWLYLQNITRIQPFLTTSFMPRWSSFAYSLLTGHSKSALMSLHSILNPAAIISICSNDSPSRPG